jgi:hypothetical protein
MDHLDIRFYGTWQGRKIYRVLRDGRAIFTGTKGECSRYIRIHQEKQIADLKAHATPRRRKVFVKRYRLSTRQAASF